MDWGSYSGVLLHMCMLGTTYYNGKLQQIPCQLYEVNTTQNNRFWIVGLLKENRKLEHLHSEHMIGSQSTTQKAKDRATQTSSKTQVNAGVP